MAERDVVNLQGSCHVFHVAQSFDVCLSGLTTCDNYSIITIMEFAASDKRRCSGHRQILDAAQSPSQFRYIPCCQTPHPAFPQLVLPPTSLLHFVLLPMSITALLFVTPPFTRPFHTFPSTPHGRTIRLPPNALLAAPQHQKTLLALAVPALPTVAYSEYTLLTTGCGLPPGPYGLFGAAEGLSYLVVAAIILISLYSKLTTGKGLPDGPAKLLGTVEALAYLLVLTGVAAAVYTVYKFGQLPNAVPQQGSRCFPTE